MSLKNQTNLLQAEVISYRKCFTALDKVYQELEQGVYGEIDERALEAVREELETLRTIALRYDILSGRIRKEDPENSTFI